MANLFVFSNLCLCARARVSVCDGCAVCVSHVSHEYICSCMCVDACEQRSVPSYRTGAVAAFVREARHRFCQRDNVYEKRFEELEDVHKAAAAHVRLALAMIEAGEQEQVCVPVRVMRV